MKRENSSFLRPAQLEPALKNGKKQRLFLQIIPFRVKYKMRKKGLRFPDGQGETTDGNGTL